MTSQSHRNHRITRWNIHQTATRDHQICTATGCLKKAPRQILTLLVTLTTCAGLATARADDQFATSSLTGRAVVESSTDSSLTLQQSRALLRSLRTGRPAPAVSPQKPTKPHVAAASPTLKKVPEPAAEPDMKVNNILLTDGDNSGAGIVTIPVLQPPSAGSDMPTPVPDTISSLPLNADSAPAQQGRLVMSPGCVAPGSSGVNGRTRRRHKTYRSDGSVVIHNFRKGTTKVRDHAERLMGPFIEYCDAEYSVDDYEMPILLVAAQEEVPVNEVTDDAEGLLSRKLSDIKPTLDYAWGDLTDSQLPNDFHKRMDNGPYVEKYAPRTVLQWAPTNLWYHPLYFEDPALERYGHARAPWLQPFCSTGRFVGQLVGLPYQMTLHPPHSREYALGYYQPGEWAPKKKYQIPWNEEAAATEFLWITGFILLIP